MHELGIILHLAKTLEQTAEENSIKKIGSVTLQIGEVSGVIPDYMTDCWNYFRKKDPLFDGAELKIEILPAVTYCSDCGRTYETVKYGKICPFCGSEKTWLQTGNELMIKEMEAVTD